MLPDKNKQTSYPIWVYCICLAFFVYLFIEILRFSVETQGNFILAGMYLVQFGAHEVSHMIVFFLPPIFVAAAGSIGEISFTLLVLAVALKQKAYFAAIFAGLWFMLAMQSVGRYIADASTQLLPLVGPSEVVQHDWHFVLGELGWLQYDTAIGGVVSWIGIVVGALGLLFGLYLIIRKIIRRV